MCLSGLRPARKAAVLWSLSHEPPLPTFAPCSRLSSSLNLLRSHVSRFACFCRCSGVWEKGACSISAFVFSIWFFFKYFLSSLLHVSRCDTALSFCDTAVSSCDSTVTCRDTCSLSVPLSRCDTCCRAVTVFFFSEILYIQ